MPESNQPLITSLLLSVLLLPFVGFLGLSLGMRRSWAGRVAVGLAGAGLLLAGWLWTLLPPEPLVWRMAWATFPGAVWPVTFRFDALTALMLVLVHFVQLLVVIYSRSYLHDEPSLPRYFAYLNLFVGAMLGIVTAGNLIVLYAFWEIVGLASYLLIGFWYERPAAAAAAKKAFLMNRVGDIGFLIGIFLTYFYTQNTEINSFTGPLPTVVGLCLFMGCVGKSAQFPLLTWLPDAMEGPTPVSALLHAATMVAAGIFLLARVHPLLSPDALLVIAVIGTVTTLWGGYSALFQPDIKKVLAFSTVSQLGLMVAGLGTGTVSGALFHLLTHAFFKAGLFLAAGSVIHAVHTQDMRHMGGLRRSMPVTFGVYLLGAAALAGVPLFSGFLSKEVILAGSFAWAARQGGGLVTLIPVGLLLSSGLTALYMARQLRLVFFDTYRNEQTGEQAVHEPDWRMRGPMVLLAVLSVGIWFSLNPLSAHGSPFFARFPADEASAPFWLAPASIALVGLGGWLGYRQTPAWGRQEAGAPFWQRLSLHYGFLDVLYGRIINRPTRQLATLLYRTDTRLVDGFINALGAGSVILAHLVRFADRRLVDGLVNGLAWGAGRLGKLTRSVQNGRVQSYIATAVVGLLLLLWWLL